MSDPFVVETEKKAAKGTAVPSLPPRPLRLAAIGLETELSLVVDGRAAKPETVFGSPTAFLRVPLVHRQGTSYHLPTGGAVYFDTGVIEVATPAIEIDRGCAARAGRSLWESIRSVRHGLDDWEERHRRRVRLVGFSTHYNVSFAHRAPRGGREPRLSIEDFSRLLVHLLPVPVMLLVANPLSTGIGVRPRGDRIEVTADFTPRPALMIAAATLITGVVRAAMRWPSYRLGELAARRLPVIDGVVPIPHTSRKGWLARGECYPDGDPFRTPADAPVWPTVRGRMSLRAIGRELFLAFRPAIRRVADPFSYRLLHSIFVRRAPVLLDLAERPAAYEDVGRLCRWDDLFPERALTRSLYERVLIHAIAGDVLRRNGRLWRPVGMHGWSEVVFERLNGGEGCTVERRTVERRTVPLDDLVRHLDAWRECVPGPAALATPARSVPRPRPAPPARRGRPAGRRPR